MKNPELAKKIHEVYLQCRDTFAPNKIMDIVTAGITDEEELQFISVVSDFFLQQAQDKIINKNTGVIL